MKIYVSLTKTTKKMIKYAILFILGCILIYYSSILNVNASDTTFNVNSLDITFPQYIHWYDNISGNLSSKSSLNYLASFTSFEDYLYLSQPASNLISTSGSGGFTLFYSLPVIEGHSYLLYNYFINNTKSAYFSHTEVNRNYRYFQSCTNTSLSSCTNMVSAGSGYLGFTEYGTTYITSSYSKFTATKTDHYINISMGTTSTITIPSGNPTIGFIGYRLIDITTYSDETIQGMIQDNQNSLDNLEDDVAILQETQQATNDKLDDQIQQDKEQHKETMDTITGTDTNGADSEANSFFNDFESNDFGLSDIITLPLTTIQSITSKSCTPLNLTLPFVNKSFQLPCMTTIYSKFEPFYSIYQTITFGVISYWVCVQIYAMVKGFKDPAKDEIEVMDL